MKLTITICTYNRSILLLKTLESINHAIAPEQADISILVIANACLDNTLDSLRDYEQRQKSEKLIPLTYAVEPTAGKSYALNKALTLIAEGFICFIDDDHRLDINYFLAIVNTITKFPESEMFCGRIIPDWTGQEPAWVHEKGKFKITPFPVPYFDLGDKELVLSEENSIPGGGNLIISTSVFKKIGRFSEHLGPKGHNLMGSEDSDFVLRALTANVTLRYIPEIIQYHYVNPLHLKLSYLMLKSYQRNRSITLARHPDRIRIPFYLWTKLIQYSANALFSFNCNKTRLFLTRLAGIFGQIVGSLQSRAH